MDIKYIDLAVQTYYLLVYAEFFSGTRRFDGRRYGVKIEESCGREVLRRILGGKEITRAEFEGAYFPLYRSQERGCHKKDKLRAQEGNRAGAYSGRPDKGNKRDRERDKMDKGLKGRGSRKVGAG